jgi:hypothetical protein
MIGDTECGGCVLATNENGAKAKVKSHYEQEYGEDIAITVWIDDEISLDVVQVYP